MSRGGVLDMHRKVIVGISHTRYTLKCVSEYVVHRDVCVVGCTWRSKLSFGEIGAWWAWLAFHAEGEKIIG